MRTWYIDSNETTYECPYCHCEIEDCTGDEIESHTEYCAKCGSEFQIEVH